MPTRRRYHYRESGLDNVYLVNGYEYVDTPRGRAVKIRNIDGLHKAIGLMLVHEKKNLSGKEFRFLRHEMNMTQLDLAAILRVDVQSIARWEKGQTKRPIDGPAQGLLRIMYQQYVTGDERITDPIKRLAELDEIMNDGRDEEHITFEDTDEGWQPSLAA